METIISAGCLIKSGDKYLLCHATHCSWKYGWGLPKGKIEPGESVIVAAFRETKEECGLDLFKEGVNFKVSIDKNRLKYKSSQDGKKIRKELCVVHFTDLDGKLINRELSCSTFCERRGKQIPEVDAYKWVTKEEALGICMKSIRPLFQ